MEKNSKNVCTKSGMGSSCWRFQVSSSRVRLETHDTKESINYRLVSDVLLCLLLSCLVVDHHSPYQHSILSCLHVCQQLFCWMYRIPCTLWGCRTRWWMNIWQQDFSCRHQKSCCRTQISSDRVSLSSARHAHSHGNFPSANTLVGCFYVVCSTVYSVHSP